MKYNSELNLEDKNSLSVLVQRVQPDSLVLEFGPANGRMSQYLKEILGCRVYAVEIDEAAAKDASEYCESLLVDSIENYRWCEEFRGIKFDYIVFADVLEHLYNPEDVLMRVREFLKEDGKILISIPNIAHNSIVINLLKNEFNYHETGLLDTTHLRFYTKKTFDELILRCGYFCSFADAILCPPERSEFQNSYQELPDEVANYLKTSPYGEVYQLLYEVQKHDIGFVAEDFERGYGAHCIQLFINEGDGFKESDSIKLPLVHYKEFQRFEFDLRERTTLQGLRLDPLDESCVIEIKTLSLGLEEGNVIDLMDKIATNCNFHVDNSYFFETIDSQIHLVETELLRDAHIANLVIELRYRFIEQQAIDVCNILQRSNHLIEQMHQLEEDNSALRQQLTDADVHMNHLQAHNRNLEHSYKDLSVNYNHVIQELANIHNSLRWKITHPRSTLRQWFTR